MRFVLLAELIMMWYMSSNIDARAVEDDIIKKLKKNLCKKWNTDLRMPLPKIRDTSKLLDGFLCKMIEKTYNRPCKRNLGNGHKMFRYNGCKIGGVYHDFTQELNSMNDTYRSAANQRILIDYKRKLSKVNVHGSLYRKRKVVLNHLHAVITSVREARRSLIKNCKYDEPTKIHDLNISYPKPNSLKKDPSGKIGCRTEADKSVQLVQDLRFILDQIYRDILYRTSRF